MSYIATVGGRSMSSGVTTVDCQKQVRSWRLLRSLMELLIPSCNCTFLEEDQDDTKSEKFLQKYPPSLMTSTTITGTIFGYRRGKVSFCIQANANSSNPILLLELAVPTSVLAKEMRGGTLRIVLESVTTGSCSTNLFSTPLWTMYCNGRKVGYAVKRRPSSGDFEALSLMRCVDVGTGVINGKELHQEDELMYLRANFQRVRGSSNCESFHLIDPEGSIGQELSIFFFRSR
ncbi:protein MIZU-KUSSEI 1-like [Abrus precatorius]|uniref:Protein MIZU-KUSSEI 1-like n=1 Tax=Abrus precatorius TaxID=3816 RepID=A0A8B8K263_ABRPR|nr:protein MIZU-KUSSEI 1-like [Abrus precatorius]